MASAAQITAIPSRSSAIGMPLAGFIVLSSLGDFSHRDFPRAAPNLFAPPAEEETVLREFEGLISAPTHVSNGLVTATNDIATASRFTSADEPLVGRESASDRATELADEIIERKRSALDWTGRDGVAPPQAAFDDALTFVDLIASEPALTKLTRLYASGDGEVGFVWRRVRDFLEVSFRGNCRIEWASTIEGRNDDGDEPFAGARQMTRLPRALERVLEQLT